MYLLDTNIVSELMRSRPDPNVWRWSQSVRQHALSVISVDEIWFGIRRKGLIKFETWFTHYLNQHLVLPITLEVAVLSGQLRGELASQGVTRSQADMLIAATAKNYGLTLVTRNTRDFQGCGITLFDPFTHFA